MVKYTKEYIELKIKECQELINIAISEAQKETYEGYLDYWRSKEEVKPEIEVIIEPEPIEIIEPEPVIEIPEEPEIADNGKIICDICGNEFAKAGFPNHRVACERKKEIQETKDKLAFLEAEKKLLNQNNGIE